ncbi:MAG TPA: isoprenylcysteine carboxylmethyltransferase family protein [Solirubrobacteraceae bacterium]
MSRRATLGSVAFFFAGPFLEALVGPWLITSGFEPGDTGPALQATGAVLIAAGAAVVLWCFARFVTDGAGTPSPLAPPARLVARGPYARSRNPMYVATATIIAGEGVLIARPLLVICAAAYLATMALLVIRVEEPLLRRRHGAEWDAYAGRVGRWL